MICRVAIPIERFYNKAEQDIEDWYELGKNDFASDIGTVSLLVIDVNMIDVFLVRCSCTFLVSQVCV